MDYFKGYIIKIIVLCAMLQLGSFVISTESFKRLYKLVGSVMLMVSILNLPSCNAEYKIPYTDPDYTVETDNNINQEFTENVKDVIYKDIKETYKIESFRVEVKSDYVSISISIFVYGNFSDEIKDSLLKYIKSKYCTDEDEVIVKNEYY